MRLPEPASHASPPSGPGSPRSVGRRGFTLLELLVVIGIIALVLAIVLPTTAGMRRSSKQIKCLSNLRQLGVGFLLYASDNHGVLPDPGQADESWELLLMPKIRTAALFRCPADEEIFPVVDSSYDWRDTGDPATTLAGQKVTAAPPGCVLAFDALPGWHARRTMNTVLIDGSGHHMSVRDAMENLSRPVRNAGTPATEPDPKQKKP